MKSKHQTINTTTLNNNLCINCGICKVVCPFDAIKMQRNKYGEINPIIDKKICQICGICVKHCPNSVDKIKRLAMPDEIIKFDYNISEQEDFQYINSKGND